VVRRRVVVARSTRRCTTASTATAATIGEALAPAGHAAVSGGAEPAASVGLASVGSAEATDLEVEAVGTPHPAEAGIVDLDEDTLTAYHLHPSRGRAAVTEFAVLPDYRGTVVHDALSVYDAYPDARHALCCAHLARELVAAAEADPDQAWPEQALRALHGLNSAAHHARDQQLSAIPPEIADPLLDSWRHALLVGLAEHRRAPGRRQSKTRNLLERLRDRDEQVLLFARDLAVPFTNNQAERDIRPTKSQLKISGCHRSETTAKAWLRIRGYISTVAKHSDNILDALRDAITGNPWKPPATC
jgi:hypothetical protein